jgi:hypothetical protein
VNRERQITELEEARLRRLPLEPGVAQATGAGPEESWRPQPDQGRPADLPYPERGPELPR